MYWKSGRGRSTPKPLTRTNHLIARNNRKLPRKYVVEKFAANREPSGKNNNLPLNMLVPRTLSCTNGKVIGYIIIVPHINSSFIFVSIFVVRVCLRFLRFYPSFEYRLSPYSLSRYNWIVFVLILRYIGSLKINCRVPVQRLQFLELICIARVPADCKKTKSVSVHADRHEVYNDLRKGNNVCMYYQAPRFFLIACRFCHVWLTRSISFPAENFISMALRLHTPCEKLTPMSMYISSEINRRKNIFLFYSFQG